MEECRSTEAVAGECQAVSGKSGGRRRDASEPVRKIETRPNEKARATRRAVGLRETEG